MSPPKFEIDFDKLPADPRARHEILVDAFGQYLFWVRAQSIGRMKRLVESEDDRSQLGSLYRNVFDEVAGLSDGDKEVALKYAESAVDNFAKLFLTMVSGRGFDDALGPHHVFRFRLDMEVCDARTGDVLFEETINRGGKKFFAEYWGRWLNRFAGIHHSSGEELGE